MKPLTQHRWRRLVVAATAVAVVATVAAACAKNDREPVCGARIDVSTANDEQLQRFASDLKLRHVDAFVNTVNYIHLHGALPPCFITKGEARKLGWQPGRRLWDVAPGRSMGGNRFGNRENRLPRKYERRYLEADLDYDGGRRGAKRLVFVSREPGAWWIWVTVDHYNSFQRVPTP